MADDRIVTELVIDADTSGADRYASAMDSAALAANKTTGASRESALAIAGVSAAVVATYAAIQAGLNYVANLNKGLADLATQARMAGLSLADLQGIKFGGAIAGLTDGQVNAGLERSSQLLNDAGRNANSLSKELAANGISVRNANGQLMSQNQLLGIAADLVNRARNPGDQRAIAEMLGFTKEWIPLLEQGSGAMSGLTAEAKKAGVVLDDEVIQRATEFDREWRKSSVEMEYYLKSALLGLLPYADDLIERLSAFVRSIDIAKAAAAIDQHAEEVFKPGEEALKEAGVGGIKIGMTSETNQAIQDFIHAPFFSDDFWAAAGRAFASAISIVKPEDVKWSNGTEGVRDTSDGAMQALKDTEAWRGAAKAWGDYSNAVVSGAGKMSTGFSRVASRGKDANDALDRAILNLQKHTAQTAADADAQGLGAGALAGFRAEATLTAAAIASNTKITPELSAKFKDLADDARDAADDLAKVKIATQIEFSNKTALLSPEDVSIAQQLRDVYGNDVTAALNSAYAAQIKFNNALKAVGDAEREAFSSFLQNMRQGKSAMDSLTSALGGFADKMAKIGGDKLFDGLKSGNLFSGLTAANDNSKNGIVEGFDAIQKQAALAKQNTFQFNGGTAMAGIAAVGAGVGIYGQSKQQAAAGGSVGSSVASGALSGAMAGAALGSIVPGIGTLIGGAVGAVGGAIMGWFGGNSGAKEAAAKAQEDWNGVKVQAADFARVLATGGAGSLTSAFAQARSQTISFADTARKAGNSAEADHLWDSYTMYVMRTAEAFRRSFGGIVDALNSGLGTNSPFASAAANVKSVGDELKGFVDDVRISFANDPVANTAGNASGGGDSQIAEAWRAAQSYLLSLLGQAPVLSEVATAISHLQGTATQLQSTLVELGMSSENAARAISEGVGKAMDALREKFDQGLTARLNTASGQGYLNDTAVLIEQFKQDSADAAMLGLDQARVAAVFRAEAQKIVDDAGLVGDSFISFATQFPELTNVVNQSTTAMQAAADAQKKILDEQVSFVQGIAKTITAYLQGLKTGASSILNPQDQLAASKSAFASQSALAQSGNRDALSGITQVAQTYLDQAKSFYASSAGYTAAYNEVTSVLQGLATVSPATVASADAQAIIAAVNSTTGAVTSTAAQSDALVTAQTTLIAASNTLASSQVSLANSQVSLLGEIRSLNSTSSQQLDLLNQQYASHPFNADAGGGSRTFDYSLREALNKIVYNTWATASNTAGGNHYVGVYARGGLITGSGTGTSDDVPIRASNGEYMITASTVDRLGVSFFDQINAGRTPAVPVAMPAFRAPNDNARPSGDGNSLTRKDIADLAKSIAANINAMNGNVRDIPAAIFAASREQVAAIKQAPSKRPGSRTGTNG